MLWKLEQNWINRLQTYKKLNPPTNGQAILVDLAKEVPLPLPPLEILTIACLTFCLLLTDRPVVGLPEYKFKAVNICKMHGSGGLEAVVL